MSLVTSSLNPAPYLTTFNVNTTLAKNQTAAQAVNIGALQESGDTISVSDQGASAGSQVSTNFTAQSGDTTSLAESFGNIVNQATTDFKLYNSTGTLIADNQGSTDQQTAYTQWVNGTLSLSADTYTAIATPTFPDLALSIKSQQQQGSSLSVNSSLTGSDQTQFYNFSLTGANIKMAFDAGSNNPSTRVQLLNANGNVVADSAGDPYQQASFQALTSNTGLSATSGNYTVEVTYAKNTNTSATIPYNFQLYSGTNYAVSYQNKITAQPTDNTASGSVTAASNAKLYSRSQYNYINATAASAINIGWIQQDKSALDVYSQLTSADSTDYYSLTLQQGNNLKFGFNTKITTTPSDLRVQVLNGTGTAVIADNFGTSAQKAAYTALTTTNGLAAKPGDYVIKVGYAPGVTHKSQTYEFGLYSGTGYSALYKTLASAQTTGNAILRGQAVGNASASAGIASYLNTLSNGGDTSSAITAALSQFI